MSCKLRTSKQKPVQRLNPSNQRFNFKIIRPTSTEPTVHDRRSARLDQFKHFGETRNYFPNSKNMQECWTKWRHVQGHFDACGILALGASFFDLAVLKKTITKQKNKHNKRISPPRNSSSTSLIGPTCFMHFAWHSSSSKSVQKLLPSTLETRSGPKLHINSYTVN